MCAWIFLKIPRSTEKGFEGSGRAGSKGVTVHLGDSTKTCTSLNRNLNLKDMFHSGLDLNYPTLEKSKIQSVFSLQDYMCSYFPGILDWDSSSFRWNYVFWKVCFLSKNIGLENLEMENISIILWESWTRELNFQVWNFWARWTFSKSEIFEKQPRISSW